MKKRIFAIILALVILALCGCSKPKSEAAQAVDKMISAIGTVTLQSEAQIEAAEKAYAALTEEQKGEIENNAILVAARAELENLLAEKAAQEEAARIEQLKQEAAKVDAKIEAVGTVTKDSGDLLAEARAAYDAATAEVQSYVTKLDKLQSMEQELLVQRKNWVVSLINQIGTVTLNSGAAIDTAQAAYDSLSSAEKAMVDNAAVLKSAAARLKELKFEEGKKLLVGMTVDNDPVRGMSFYYPKAFPYYASDGYWGADVRSFVLPYLGMQGNEVWLRLVCNYTANDWVFFEKITFAVDDQRFYKTFSYFDVTRDNDGGDVWEYVDLDVGASNLKLLEAIASSNTTIVRFEGDNYYRDVTISAADKQAIRQMLNAYYALGGE